MNARVFKPLLYVFSTPVNLLVGISGALKIKEIYFLSINMFWENVVEYLRNSVWWSFQTFAIVFSTPVNLLVQISGTLVMKESHTIAKMCFEKIVVNARPCKLFHCVQHSLKLTSRDFWSSRNERKPLSTIKCVLRKCCRYIRIDEC